MRACASEYDLTTARTLAEAHDLLSRNDGWRPIAGGTDLMVLSNAGKLLDRRFISVLDIPELCQIEVSENTVLIGAAVTYSKIRRHPTLNREFPLLCQAAAWTGGVANQNRGTLGGNIANASPAADSAPALLVYDAELELTSRSGSRWLPYAKFHTGYKQMQLRSDELITRIRLERPLRDSLDYARKVGTRRAQAISKVCFAARGQRMSGVLQNIRIAIGSVAPVPLRCYETERVLEGRALDRQLVTRGVDALRLEIQPITDGRSTEWYRAQVAVNLLAEFLASAG